MSGGYRQCVHWGEWEPMDDERAADAELSRWLNLLNASRDFVLVEGPSDAPYLRRLEAVPAESGLVWLAGTLRLANGNYVDAVLNADAATGELQGAYVESLGEWHVLSEETVSDVLNLTLADVFPFDYEFAIPFETNHFR